MANLSPWEDQAVALVTHLLSLQPAQLGPGTAHCTRLPNGDS